MNAGTLTGLVIGAGLVAAVVLAPQLLPAKPAETRDGEDQAALALRELASYSVALDSLGQRLAVDPDAQQRLRAGENPRLLQSIQSRARDATSKDSSLVEAHLVAGKAAMLEAESLRIDAARARAEIGRMLLRARELARARRLFEIKAESVVAVEVEPVLADLRSDDFGLAWAQRERDDAAGELEALQTEIEVREAELVVLANALRDTRAARDQLAGTLLTQSGDPAAGGSDDFENFSAEYERLTGELARLQAREELLRFGGLVDARFDDGPDPTVGMPIGGTRILGLETLARQREEFAAKLVTFNKAVATYEQQVEKTSALARNTQRDQQAINDRQTELETQLKQLLRESIPALQEQAMKAENDALQAAQRAASAFDRASTAAGQRKRVLTDAQQLDPQRTNPRLTTGLDTTLAAEIGVGSKIAAQLLEAHIYQQRISGGEDLLTALEAIEASWQEQEAQTEEIRAALTTAEEAAINLCEEAISAAQRLERGYPTGIKYIARMLEASATYRLSQIATDRADELQTATANLLDAALEDRTQSPYLAPFVSFAQHVYRVSGYVPTGDDTSLPDETSDTGSDDTTSEVPAGFDS